MSRKTKWFLGVAGALSILTFVGYKSAPALVRWYINRRPDVKVDSVEIANLHTFVLHGIKVTRPEVEGEFTTATVDRDAKTIVVTGGHAKILDAKKSGGESSGFKVTANAIDVDATKEGVSVHLTHANVSAKEVCFEKAEATHEKGSAEATEGCFSRDTNHITFKTAKVTPTKPFHGETLEPVYLTEGEVTRNGLDGTVTLGVLTYQTNNALGVKVTKDGKKLDIYLDQAGFTYDKVSANALIVRKIKAQVQDFTNIYEGTVEVEINGVQIHLEPAKRHVWASATCQEWLDALPNELREGPLQEVKFTGDLSFDLALKPDVKLAFKETCKTIGTPDFIKALKGEFQYVVYDAKKNETTRTTGPRSKNWVSLHDVSENMILALLSTEDGAFFYHHGFIPQAIENSIKENLKADKFVRGGSTLTMQLAKNLWLRRSKTLGRKIQEAFLTMVLESNLSKQEIFALYLNVVEFGPNIYGIKEAAKQLLDTDPYKLTLTQSIYLAQRLPNPLQAGPLDDSKKAGIKRILDFMVQTKKITPEVAAGEMESDADSAPNVVVNQ